MKTETENRHPKAAPRATVAPCEIAERSVKAALAPLKILGGVFAALAAALALAFAAPAAFAGDEDAAPPKEFADALREALNSSARWTMEKRIPQMKKPLKSSGVVSCVAKKGIRWETQTPFRTLLVMDADGLTKTDGGDGSPQAIDVPHYSRIRGAIDAALDGDCDKLQSVFKVVESKVDDEAKTFRVRLEPSESRIAEFIKSVEVAGTVATAVTGGAGAIAKGAVAGANGAGAKGAGAGAKGELTLAVFSFADGSETAISFTRIL